ncbi:hypothetical protein [Achromobacter deleyi]|uniref:hypothetical protein n=1 Tax=Achromobacter deleyi TaxID=1353891 RepID=UPI001490BD7F|nr:hypothetical protein [Achromobacter deleyi]QVQ27348.1 hypothetical protein HLG70_02520 [Achromobacter deleyi]UIP22942.1 hypothetical protein LYZ39_10625 [Achromobacter deleyi]
MHIPSALAARKPRACVLMARLGLAVAAGVLASPAALAQKWFEVPPRPDHPNIAIRIGAMPDSRQPSGSAKGKMELRYAVPQSIPGKDRKRRNYNRSVTDVVFDCNQSLVGFLAATNLYMNDDLVDTLGDEIADEGQTQFVRFPESSPQMKALQLACARP